MDAYEATRIVLSRIQNLDPENASKIMGLLLIQDHGDKEMIRLAFGPEAFVHSVVLKARKELGISSSTSPTPSTPPSPLPFLPCGNPLSRQHSSSSRTGLPSPLSIAGQSSSSWASSCFSDFQSTDDLVSPSSNSASYSAVNSNGIGNLMAATSSSSMNSSAPPFYGGGGADLIDEFQLQQQLSFLNDGSPTTGPKSPDLFYPHPDLSNGTTGGDAVLFHPYGGAATNWAGHRRSSSVSDLGLGSEDPTDFGFGWKHCLYYARGFCKNGTSCRFLHGGKGDPAAVVSDGGALVGSPGKLEMLEQCQALLRSKSAHQQRISAASQLMASSNPSPYSSAPAAKCMNFLLQQQQNDSPRGMAALMMGEDMHKFGRSRFERSDFPLNGGPGMANPGSRQIYLTFPADSTFREEDVSNYFSIYGPVQDVRIPYQQKRMFGFVTFVYPETVKLILAKGNPHFVCDARVLVKPYKEKGKVPDKFRKQQQQQVERGEFSAYGSPTGLDSRDPYDLGRFLCNTQDMLWRRKLEEQADLQQAAIELQGRRLMGLQLLDVKRHNHHRTLSTGGALSSLTSLSSNFFNQPLALSSDCIRPEATMEDNGPSPPMAASLSTAADHKSQQTVNASEKEKELPAKPSTEESENGKGDLHQCDESELLESLEHVLPDSPFASPRAAGNYATAFSATTAEAEKNAAILVPTTATSNNNNLMINSSLFPATSTLDMASLKSCYFQVPRFSSGHGAIGM